MVSSPVIYPPISNAQYSKPGKRRRSDDVERRGVPLQPVSSNQVLKHSGNLFLQDSDEEDVDPNDSLEHSFPTKRPRLEIDRAQLEETAAGQPTTNVSPRSDAQNPRAPLLGRNLLSRNNDSQASISPSIVENRQQRKTLTLKTTSGKTLAIRPRKEREHVSYEQLVAARSEIVAGRAQRNYYGIEVNRLLDEANAEDKIRQHVVEPEQIRSTVETSPRSSKQTRISGLMWTEKYRAKKFTDLIGDDRTHRNVMHWLKSWDPIVFPDAPRRTHTSRYKDQNQMDMEDKTHKKILLLTGPAGLGKTTLAHVCARQAGYEVSEINASDERSKDVVNGRIRDMLGTENVKSTANIILNANNGQKKIAKPLCVIVDEVDGVVSGSGGSGEGGFIKALIDLLLKDQKNESKKDVEQAVGNSTKKRKGDNFRMMRPMIMICNDAYHNALRLLRTSQFVEIVHVGRPMLNNVALRMQNIFEREGIDADADAVRRLCESCWGSTSKKEGGTGSGVGEGDIRSVMVMAEWIAGRLRADFSTSGDQKSSLSKKWLETNMSDASSNGALKGLGRGGSKEIVERVFMEGGGLSTKPGLAQPSFVTSTPSGSIGGQQGSTKSVNEAKKTSSITQLRTLIDGFGETDKIISDLHNQYTLQPYQDDTFLSKPHSVYNWLHFYDSLSSQVFGSSEWELAPYLSSPILSFHLLFATSTATRARYAPSIGSSYSNNHISISENHVSDEAHPFTGQQASYLAHERQKHNHSLLQSLHENLSLSLNRLYPKSDSMALEFIPYVLRMISPAVSPVLITSAAPSSSSSTNAKITTACVRKASEKLLVARSIQALLATGLKFEKHRVDSSIMSINNVKTAAGFIYRLAPALDEYGVYDTASSSSSSKTGNGSWGNDVAGISAPGQRYAVRQVLAQECVAEERTRSLEERAKRNKGLVASVSNHDTAGGEIDMTQDDNHGPDVNYKNNSNGHYMKGIKRDFFGRVLHSDQPAGNDNGDMKKRGADGNENRRVWVSFHEGFSNAVRKPLTLAELMKGF